MNAIQTTNKLIQANDTHHWPSPYTQGPDGFANTFINSNEVHDWLYSSLKSPLLPRTENTTEATLTSPRSIVNKSKANQKEKSTKSSSAFSGNQGNISLAGASIDTTFLFSEESSSHGTLESLMSASTFRLVKTSTVASNVLTDPQRERPTHWDAAEQQQQDEMKIDVGSTDDSSTASDLTQDSYLFDGLKIFAEHDGNMILTSNGSIDSGLIDMDIKY